MTNSSQPNFLVIVADDLGYSDVGCYGSEIRTPNLDALGRTGARFTDFHSAAMCSPTRSMLMSGTDHHLTGLGQLNEFIRGSAAHKGKKGHEGYLTSNIATLPEVLRDGGYHTMMAGKWHLGLRPEHAPCSRGFDKSFAFLPGCGNHFAWEPQLTTSSDEPRFFETAVAALHIEGDKYVDNDTLPADFYSSDFYVDKLLQYMKERPKEKPFFAYLPFSAPHWPLQAPKESMAPYRGKYDEGPDVLRQQRLQGLMREGLVAENTKPHPVMAPGLPEWKAADQAYRDKSARSMEAFAGMVDRMDSNIGRVLSYLRDQHEIDNTMIIFMSDNGAEGASYEARDWAPDVLKYIGRFYNNALENIGSKDSFVWYGSRWAQASTAPSRLYKQFSTEGGIHVPFILKYPGMVEGQIIKEFCTVMDIMPTLLELAGVKRPGAVYNGREVIPMHGSSWIPYFSGTAKSFHDDDHVTGWEIVGQAALRKGKWKINWVAEPYGINDWQLYDLSVDPAETNDLGKTHPELLQEMIAHWKVYAKETGVVGLQPEFEQLGIYDDMDDPRKWMKFDTSRAISSQLKAERAEKAKSTT